MTKECSHYQSVLKIKKHFIRERWNLRFCKYIGTCLVNYKIQTFKNILNNLLKPNFIREYDEYQELLQYMIKTDINH